MKSLLSYPSKMPCPAYNLPASRCKTGSELAKIPGTVCSKCYALKGRYNFKNVQAAMNTRLKAIFRDRWVDQMVLEIRLTGCRYFRWHDSGDLQGVWHLDRIVDIAHLMPGVKFWLPTREKAIVTGWKAENGDFPPNLTVRVSGALVDGPPPKAFPLTSTVVSDPKKADCPATTVRSTCDDCRRCWDRRVKNVAYLEH